MSIDDDFNHFTAVLEDAGKYDLKKINKAWAFARLAHHGQKRLSGEDYVIHPLEVAQTLARWKLDTTSIIAGLLHDTIEDGGARREDLVNEFGEEVALLVDGVTNVTKLRLKGSKEKEFTENLRKMLLVMAKDIRVVLLKLADRLHNMKTLWALSPASQIENSRETLEIYAPLAERLGIGSVKGELEDLAFPYVYPVAYKELTQVSKKSYKEAEGRMNVMKRKLLTELQKEDLEAQVHARKKHLYSLWKKLKKPEIDGDLGKIYDIVALRILVKDVPDCYVALGIVHRTFKPVPHIGVSDFIAQPKPNGYRSIHTKVFGPGGHVVEVQIRTFEMHEQAERGIAAHWSYSEAKAKGATDAILNKGVKVSSKLAWVKRLVAWQKELTDPQEFLEAVKFDALGHRNFIFSPKGDVFDLPAGATPVDFAFAVHTNLGRYISGAKVDGRIVPLNSKLQSGQVVEIIKSKNPTLPKRDWLDFVVTAAARHAIRRELKT